ncbi:MAG TPA: hypothetical protein VLG76_03125 [Rhabdochlamydiaceae bacterium]|nr:hypothetical protein [Rhabdochlamydiaceae bacterium]
MSHLKDIPGTYVEPTPLATKGDFPFEVGGKDGAQALAGSVDRAASATLSKSNARTQSLYRKITIGLAAIATYPMVNLALTLIAGATITLTPANIVLLSALALFVLITIAYLIKERRDLKVATRVALENLLIFSSTPISLSVLTAIEIKNRVKRSVAQTAALFN